VAGLDRVAGQGAGQGARTGVRSRYAALGGSSAAGPGASPQARVPGWAQRP